MPFKKMNQAEFLLLKLPAREEIAMARDVGRMVLMEEVQEAEVVIIKAEKYKGRVSYYYKNRRSYV
jgi:hypothetical protein